MRQQQEPFAVERTVAPNRDLLRLKILQFYRVIRGEERPIVSGRGGLQTLCAITAVQQAAQTGDIVRL
jgi:hypothetical protein